MKEDRFKKGGLAVATTLALLLVATALGGCSSWGERTWLRTPGWSRGEVIGVMSISDPAPVAVGTDGTVYVAIIVENETGDHPHIITLNESGAMIWEKTYEDELILPDSPALLWDGERLNLLWMSDRSVYLRMIYPDGEPQGNARLLSGETSVGSYAAAVSPEGDLAVWYAGTRADPSVYGLPIGDPLGKPHLIDPKGTRPDLKFDRFNTLHAVWAQHPRGYEQTRFLYARFPTGAIDPSYKTILFEPLISINHILHGPHLGIDKALGYLVWTLEIRVGMEAGQMTTSWISFPLEGIAGKPSKVNIRVPSQYTLEYRDADEGGLRSGERFPLGDGRYATSDKITDFAFNPSQDVELAAVFSVNIEYLRRKDQWQIGALYFDGNAPQSYQLLSFTPAESRKPYLQADAHGNLFLTWLERQSTYGSRVYFASTRPETRDALSVIHSSDITQFIAESLFGMVSGIVLIPIGLIWMVAGAVVVLFTGWLRKENEPLLSPGTLISISLGIAAFWGAKLFIFPNYFEYVPFSAWIPVLPEAWELPLRYGVPILTFLIGLGAALRYTYGNQERMPLFFVLIYSLVDSFITLALYGVIIWAAF